MLCPVVVNYTVVVKTGTDFGSGTDANVYLTIYGSLRNNTAIQLTKGFPANPFENGDSDQFIITTLDLGKSGLSSNTAV